MAEGEALTRHPHDTFFKGALSDPLVAAQFFQSHLPPVLAAQVQWNTLELLPGSYVSESLRQAHSDLHFSVQAGGVPLLLYLIFEHQTAVDAAMPLRLLGCVFAILQRHEKQHGLSLPPVVSFVLPQGPERWTVSPQFADLFAVPPALAEVLRPFLPEFRHGLLDLSVSDPAGVEPVETRVVLQLMKLARALRLHEFFTWLAEITEIADLLPPWLLRLVLLYALHNEANLDVETIGRNLAANPKLQTNVMSLAQKLRAEGKAEGAALGTWRGKLQLLEELMGAAPTPEHELEPLRAAELERRFMARQAEYNGRFKGTK